MLFALTSMHPLQHVQDKLLDMLCAFGCMTPEWWKETLLGPIPDSRDQLL